MLNRDSLRPHQDRRPWLQIAAHATAVFVSVTIYSVVLLRPILFSAPGPFQSLRTAYWYDQLGYLTIVANTAEGDLRPVEPMTLTGVNYYPRNYYLLVGLIARALDLQPITAWNLVSIGLQVTAVATLAVAIGVLSSRWWLGMLAPAPFLIGTLSVVTNGGSWFRSLDSHAVLWGPYGVLFSNNAETSALSIIIVVLCAIALVWARPAPRWARVSVSLVASAALGALSGFQTYSFLTGVYLVAAILAGVFLSRSRWIWTALSGAGFIAVIAFGPLVSSAVGQLATLVFGLLPLVPGLIRGIIISRGWLLLYGGVMAVAALPPIVWTVSGVVRGDPFLSYRTGSNVDLDVVHPGTLIASLPFIAVMALIITIAVRAKDRLSVSAAAGAVAAVPYLALNDQWGAQAEPYRFWINCTFIATVVGALVLARVLPRRKPSGRGDGEAIHPQGESHRRAGRGRVVALAAMTGVIYLVSLADVVAFDQDAGIAATWDPGADRERAISAAADAASASAPGLILTDSCVSPLTTKVLSPGPIAHYFLGMSWPASVGEVQELLDQRNEGTIEQAAVEDADATWLLIDSTCSVRLDFDDFAPELVGEYGYGADNIELWRLVD